MQVEQATNRFHGSLQMARAMMATWQVHVQERLVTSSLKYPQTKSIQAGLRATS